MSPYNKFVILKVLLICLIIIVSSENCFKIISTNTWSIFVPKILACTLPVSGKSTSSSVAVGRIECQPTCVFILSSPNGKLSKILDNEILNKFQSIMFKYNITNSVINVEAVKKLNLLANNADIFQKGFYFNDQEEILYVWDTLPIDLITFYQGEARELVMENNSSKYILFNSNGEKQGLELLTETQDGVWKTEYPFFYAGNFTENIIESFNKVDVSTYLTPFQDVDICEASLVIDTQENHGFEIKYIIIIAVCAFLIITVIIVLIFLFKLNIANFKIQKYFTRDVYKDEFDKDNKENRAMECDNINVYDYPNEILKAYDGSGEKVGVPMELCTSVHFNASASEMIPGTNVYDYAYSHKILRNPTTINYQLVVNEWKVKQNFTKDTKM